MTEQEKLKQMEQRCAKVLKYQIIAYFCMDYHSGQWSRGYKLQCLVMKRLKSMEDSAIFGLNARFLRNTNLYKQLESKYSEKM
jgi:hypothetical protein